MTRVKSDYHLESLIRNPKYSVYREHFLEHLFISELIPAAWVRGMTLMISRTEFDGWGYDLTIDGGGMVRYVQLKGKARSSSVMINGQLKNLKGACVVLLIPSISDIGKINLKYRLFQSSKIGPISIRGLKTAKFTRYVRDASGAAVRKERKDHYKLPIGRFSPPLTCDQLVTQLF